MSSIAAAADPFRLLTVNETAERLGISTRAVYRATCRGEIRTVSLGRSIRIREIDLLAWLEGAEAAA